MLLADMHTDMKQEVLTKAMHPVHYFQFNTEYKEGKVAFFIFTRTSYLVNYNFHNKYIVGNMTLSLQQLLTCTAHDLP